MNRAGTSGPEAEPIERVLQPFQRFARSAAAGGIVLLACTVVALALANSPWAEGYAGIWQRKFGIGSAGFGLTLSLQHWINDGLMAVFFLVVGLEIKRELLVGELASLRSAAFPIAGAIGGILAPAGLYAVINGGGPGAAGWGIPMATDIAFALGVLALLGPRVPLALKIFLAALAIVDDIGAMLVIALFYSSELSPGALGWAGGLLALLVLGNRLGVRHPLAYALVGLMLWVAVFQSGLHATIAGVLLAGSIPAGTRLDPRQFRHRARSALDAFDRAVGGGGDPLTSKGQRDALQQLGQARAGAQPTLLRLEQMLHGPVDFLILPLFALANAGVPLAGELPGSLAEPISLGIVAGLVVGKPVGITLLAWLAVRLGLAARPSEVSWLAVHAVSWLAGIGFTMSIFIAGLAFAPGDALTTAKLGILAASLVAGAVGGAVLRTVTARPERVRP